MNNKESIWSKRRLIKLAAILIASGIFWSRHLDIIYPGCVALGMTAIVLLPLLVLSSHPAANPPLKE